MFDNVITFYNSGSYLIECEQCGRRVEKTRPAQTCSPKCRKALQRKNKRYQQERAERKTKAFEYPSRETDIAELTRLANMIQSRINELEYRAAQEAPAAPSGFRSYNSYRPSQTEAPFFRVFISDDRAANLGRRLLESIDGVTIDFDGELMAFDGNALETFTAKVKTYKANAHAADDRTNADILLAKINREFQAVK